MASRRMHGDRSSRTADLVSVPVGEETGLPLVPCPDCKLARVIERRSKKENHNLGRVYFKCPRDGVSFFVSSLVILAMLGLIFFKIFPVCETLWVLQIPEAVF